MARSGKPARCGRPATILVADWSKRPARRAVWCAEVGTRRVVPLARERRDLAALLGAAALLRRALEGGALDDSELDDRVAEGGILLTSALDLDRPARRLTPSPGAVCVDRSRPGRP